MRSPGRVRWLVGLVAVVMLATLAGPADAVVAERRPVGKATVMTRNLYFGADLTPVIEAAFVGQEAFVGALTLAYVEATGTDFSARMDAVAAEIAEHEPLLVGLQEAATWLNGPVLDPAPAETVVTDFVDLIIGGLAARGLEYEAVAVAPGFEFESPLPLGFDARLIISDVILARADLPRRDFRAVRPRTGSYETVVTFDTAIGPIVFPRQWAAVDGLVRGKRFRFVTTHLESIHPLVRAAQAAELLAAPILRTRRPVIAVGDFNSEIATVGDAAWLMTANGFTDAWTVAGSGDGFTCCHDALLADPGDVLSTRIDLVFVRGKARVRRATFVESWLGSPPPLWASDHAGVVVTANIKN